MITYEVHLNGKILTIAGGPDVCVLSVTLAAVGELGPDCENARGCPAGVEMDLHVGGLKVHDGDGQHQPVHWVEESPIHVGDEIVIRIRESRAADPCTGHVVTPSAAPSERAAFDRARELYFSLRHKYPTDPSSN